MINTKKIMIAMSGGVDSTAAALLLMQQGFACEGAMMRLFVPKDTPVNSLGEIDSEEAARLAAQKLGVPFHLFNMEEEFRAAVIENFISSYAKGETPNPCVVCNKKLKFGAFLEKARELGCDAIATGHYAQIKKAGDRYLLFKGADHTKDQSYVLYNMTQDVLAHLQLPLGSISKAEARDAARGAGLLNADRGDSQDICFVPDGDYAKFISENSDLTFAEGDFILEDGTVKGRHKGIINYTVGQRRGLGLSLPAPLYVKSKNMHENTVILSSNEGLFEQELTAREANWIAFDALGEPLRCEAKIRYRHAQSPCTVYPIGENQVKVVFDEPQRAISPGQSVVFYDGDCVLGGGIID